MKLKVGERAPVFSSPDQSGEYHQLSEYKGGWLLLYFYPKDNTPGCTAEACSLRDNFSRFQKADIKIVGVSVDPVISHQEFASKYELPFTILSDERHEMVNAYGVWGRRKFMGLMYEGTSRTSFLINPFLRIVKIYEDVDPRDHADEILADIEELKRNIK